MSPRRRLRLPDDLRLAVDVALATRRALLLEGPAGAGKSMLAEAVARNLGWRFYREVVTSRTQSENLLWTIDHVRRIGDAQAGRGGTDLRLSRYLTPGPLWWAFDRSSASTVAGYRDRPLPDPSLFDRPLMPAVILLDEIDKADADMPNDLLVPLGSMQFRVGALDHDDPPTNNGSVIDLKRLEHNATSTTLVTATAGEEPLVVITSNQERDLSEAFLRRCVRFTITLPDRATYRRIAAAQVPGADRALIETLADALVNDDRESEKVSIAAFVDAVHAAVELDIDPTTNDGRRLVEVFRRWQYDPASGTGYPAGRRR